MPYTDFRAESDPDEAEGLPTMARLLTSEERERVGEALDHCTGSFKRLISPLLPYERVLSFLHRELTRCQEESGGSTKEALTAFALRMEEPGSKQYVEDLLSIMRAEPLAYQDEKVEDTWITDFQNQVDYVPGLSKGKRLVSLEVSEQYVTLGGEMKETGNRAFANQEFEMALTRYTQGVELLSNVQSKDAESETTLRALRLVLLTNQAAAALRVGSYRVAVAACTACLVEEPHNLKARARRAEARKELGEVDEAREDLNFILKLTNEDVEGEGEKGKLLAAKRVARREMIDLVSMEEQEKSAAHRMIKGSDWSSEREQEKMKEDAAPQTKPYDYGDPVSPFSTTNGSSNAPSKAAAPRETLMEEAAVLRVQEELRALYESEAIQVRLIQMRKAAEYEELRFIQRLRPFLIEAVAPVLDAHGLGKGEAGYKHMEKAIAQHLPTSALVKDNAKEILNMLMGDLADS